MLKAMHFLNSKSKRIEIDKKTRGGFIWLDCPNPTKDELRQVSKKYSIRMAALEDSLNEQERARVHSIEEYHAIIYKIPYFKNGHVRTDSVGVFWIGNTVITVHKGTIKNLSEIMGSTQRELTTPANLIHYLFEILTNTYFRVVEHIEEEIEKLEEKVVKPSTRTHTKNIFQLRKSLIYVYKSLIANREVLQLVKDGRVFELNRNEKIGFNDIYNDSLQLIDLTATQTEILATIMETDISSSSTALREVMKKLTVIASFALVPTLIASVYGMNFRPNSPWNMPELDWVLGYPFSLLLMTGSVASMFYYFKKNKWL